MSRGIRLLGSTLDLPWTHGWRCLHQHAWGARRKLFGRLLQIHAIQDRVGADRFAQLKHHTQRHQIRQHPVQREWWDQAGRLWICSHANAAAVEQSQQSWNCVLDGARAHRSKRRQVVFQQGWHLVAWYLRHRVSLGWTTLHHRASHTRPL